MTFRTIIVSSLVVLLTAGTSVALSPSNDLLIPGAARTARWTTDLFINNPGTTSVGVDVLWLVRNQPNPNPESRSFTVAGGETLVLKDVIRENFGLNRGDGAFRIVATGGEVSANLLVYAPADGGGTLGAGFEAIPANAAVQAGDTTYVMGLLNDGTFYTNVFALAGADGATMTLDLLDPDGTLLDSATVELEAYEPWLTFRTDIWNVGSYDDATLRATATAGSMVILGSKIDEESLDPTTLESQFGAAAQSVDGTYQFAFYDSFLFASGGELVISDEVVEYLNGTYLNFDKVDGEGNFECTLIFQLGTGLPETDVEDFESGVEFEESYPDSGDMTWTVSFTIDDNLGFSGTIDAVGSNFSGIDEGCNGTFPTLVLRGGKAN
jgi:hypothetical protein